MATFTPSTRLDKGTNRVQWNSRFVCLPQPLLTHPGFSELSGGASKLLLTLLSDYVGNNNGHLMATFSRMKKRGFNSKDSLARGLRELIQVGYIVRTCSQHMRSPALYAITWLPINQPLPGRPYDPGITPGDEALDDWRHFDPRMVKVAA